MTYKLKRVPLKSYSAPASGFSISASALPIAPPFFINQASSIIPEVASIKLTSTGSTSELRIRASAVIRRYANEFATSVFLDTFVPPVPPIPSRNDIEIPLNLQFIERAANRITETVYETLSIRAIVDWKDNSGNLRHEEFSWSSPIAILSPSTFCVDVASAHAAIYYPMLAAFVTPNEPAVTAIVHQASQLAKGKALSLLTDYGETLQEAKMLFNACATRKYGVSVPQSEYVSVLGDNNSFQCVEFARPSLPRDSIRDGLVECVSASLLYSSVLEAASHFPVLVILAGPAVFHAMVGYFVKASGPKHKKDSYFPLFSKYAAVVTSELLNNAGSVQLGRRLFAGTGLPLLVPGVDPLQQGGWTLDFVDPLQLRVGGSFNSARYVAHENLKFVDKICSMPNGSGAIGVKAVSICHERAARGIVSVPAL
jgi:hypothetical protein